MAQFGFRGVTSLLLIPALAITFACDGPVPTAPGPSTPTATVEPTPTVEPTQTPLPIITPEHPLVYPTLQPGTLEENVAVELLLPLSEAAADDQMHFDLRITNVQDYPVPIAWGSRGWDFVIEQDGELVWNWNANRGHNASLQTHILEPGDSMSPGDFMVPASSTWDIRDNQGVPVPVGEYEVHAVFSAFQGLPGGGSEDVETVRIAPQRIVIQDAQ